MGLSIWQLLLFGAIVLLAFGPGRLPRLGRSLGEALRSFKRGLNEDPEIDVTDSVKREELDRGDSTQNS